MTNYKRILAIGDIHGNFTKLKNLWDKVKFDKENDLLIFLGDYIDRGKENKKVLEFILNISEEKNVICLRGNHEQMMLEYIFNDNDLWIPNGGNTTIKELSKDEEFFKKTVHFCSQLKLSYKINVNDKVFFFCHAGVNGKHDLDSQDESDLIWIRNEFIYNYNGDDVIIVGHTPVQFLVNEKFNKPLFDKNKYFCDTGSYLANGKISCVDVLNKTFLQSD